MVKLYTLTVCPKCMLIKNVLQGAEVEYEAVNMDEDEGAKEYVKSKGFLAAPVLEVNGELFGEMSQIQSKISELAQ